MAQTYLYAGIPGTGPDGKRCSDCAHRIRLTKANACICGKISEVVRGAQAGQHRNAFACNYFEEGGKP